MTVKQNSSDATTKRAPCIIVHGGAWAIPASAFAATLNGVQSAVRAGDTILRDGGSALDAVEAAVRVLEDDPAFDAGRGSCLNSAGGVEMDAAVMTDSEQGPSVGSVAAVSSVRNPIVLARRVMERTPHCLLVGEGADAFAKEVGVERINSVSDLVSEAAFKEWENYEKYGDAVSELFNHGKRVEVNFKETGHDTVGCVAMDVNGNLACGTSTGGITYKRAGRVGDSPIVGSGLFCDADVGACSTTGHGESIMKVTLARYALMLMEQGMSATEAASAALDKMKQKTGGCGGLILVDKEGGIGFEFSTTHMAWASVDQNGIMKSGIDDTEA